VRRKPGNRKLVCSGCGRKLAEAYDTYEREVRDRQLSRKLCLAEVHFLVRKFNTPLLGLCET